MVTTTRSFCRLSHAFCAIEVDVEDDRFVAVREDAEGPMYGAYTCVRGRQLPAQHNHPDRLVRNEAKSDLITDMPRKARFL
ncbi:MAG TPA: hypothetical protein QGF35_08530 [Dehalococcoidia bacterium]|nr:hypothetical protein [Dehalococcoidia bacterium]